MVQLAALPLSPLSSLLEEALVSTAYSFCAIDSSGARFTNKAV